MPGYDPDRTADYRTQSANGTAPNPDAVAPTEAASASGDFTAPAGYELLDEVGRGGMGVVYRARDVAMNRDVAVKILSAKFQPNSAVARRFIAEARITGQLQHPGIPAVHQVGALPDGRPFLAMKLIKGRTLDAILRDGEDRGRMLAVFEQVAQAVGYAHAHQVIHRDLKPANVMVGAFGEVQVMDWGLAKVLSSGVASASRETDDNEPVVTEIRSTRDADLETQAGSMLGTPAYMPPEQAIGAVDQVDERSDVFGLGAILCAILTGQPPYAGGDAESTRQMAARAKLDDAFARLDASGAEPDLVLLARRCLAVERTDRPRNAEEVAHAVAELRAAAEQRARQAELDRARIELEAVEQRKRRRLRTAAVSSVVAVLVAGLAATTAGMAWAVRAEGREVGQRHTAENQRDRAEGAEAREAAQRQVAEKQRDLAEKARDRAGHVLDTMTSAVTGDSLASQKAVSAEQKRFLVEVLTYYQDFSGESSENEPSRHRTAAAANRVGLIEDRLGHQAEAAAAFRRARDWFAALAADFPAVPSYRQGLAGTLSNLGLMSVNVGKPADAEVEFRRALAVREQLADDFPAVPAYRRELAASHNNLGILLKGFGKRAQASEEYRQALTIREKLAADFPAVPEYRLDLARSHNNLANLLGSLGQHAEAEAEYRAVIRVEEKLTADFPAVPTYRQDLAQSFGNLGALLAQLGKTAAAAEAFRSALALEEKLAAEYPAVPEYRQDVAQSRNNLGHLLVLSGKAAEGEVEHRKALAIQDELAAVFPNVPAYRQDLALSRNNLANLLADLGKSAEAETEYRRALEIREKLAADSPTVPVYRQDLAQTHLNQGNLFVGLRKRSEAESEYRKAIAIFEKLATDFPAVPAYRQDLGTGRNNLGFLLGDLGKMAEAEEQFRTGLAIQERLVADFSAVPAYRDELARTCYNFACLLALASSKEAGKKQEYADRAMEMLRKAVTSGYTDAEHMAKDADLDPIRQRDDFRNLLTQLQAKDSKNAKRFAWPY